MTSNSCNTSSEYNRSLSDRNINMYTFDDMSYKELQYCAKQWKIPANMQRKVLIQALSAYQGNEPILSRQIVEDYKENRKRRNSNTNNKPQNLSTKRRGRFAKSSRGKDEIIVDSTSMDVKDVLSFNPSSSGSNNIMCDNGNSNPSERFALMNRLSRVPQFQLTPEFSRFSGPIGTCENRFTNMFNYDHTKFSFKGCASSTPLKPSLVESNYTPIHQNPVLYQHAEFSSYYNCHGIPPIFRQQSTNFPQVVNHPYDAEYLNDTANQNYSTPSSSTQISYSFPSKDNDIPPIPQNNNCNDNLQEKGHAMEIDCPSHLLPNIPQLDASTSDVPTGNPGSWSYNTLLFHQSERSDIVGSEISSNKNYTTSNNVSQSQNNHSSVTNDDNSVNAELDSNSDEETLSFSEDIASLLDWNKVDNPKTVPNISGNGNCVNSQSATIYGNQINPIKSTINYYPSSNFQNLGYEAARDMSYTQDRKPLQQTTPAHSDNFTHQSAPTCLSSMLDLLPVSSVCPVVSQSTSSLPPINNIFDSFNTNQAAETQNQQYLMKMYHYSNNGSMDLSNVADNAEYFSNFSSLPPKATNDLDSINLVTPISSPKRRIRDESVLRNCLTNDQNSGSETSKSVMRKRLESDSSGQLSNNQDHSCSDKNALNNNIEVILRKALQENQVFNDLAESSNDGRGIENPSSTSALTEEPNPGMRQLIYESETLHRSKIICSIPNNETRFKSGVHELLESYLKKDSAKDSSPLTMIRMSSMENNGTQKQIMEKTPITINPASRPCIFQNRGCSVVMKVNHSHAHEKKCVFQPVCCPADTCYWENSMNLLTRHIYENHKPEMKKRRDFVYLIDRKLYGDQPFHTFFQLYKEVIYIIRLHIEAETCIAVVQYIPEIESVTFKKKRVNGIMQLLSFCQRLKMKSWKGTVQPFYEENHEQQQEGTIQVNVHDSEFVALRLLVN